MSSDLKTKVALASGIGLLWHQGGAPLPQAAIDWILGGGSIKLNEAQTSNLHIILNTFQDRGMPRGMAVAAAVNAYAESRLNTMAVSPAPEDSVGLFQLNSAKNAAGFGLSRSARMNPTTNTLRIITTLENVVAESEGNLPSIRSAFWRGGTISEMTELFTIYVERPANRVKKGKERAVLGQAMFPRAMGLPAILLGGRI